MIANAEIASIAAKASVNHFVRFSFFIFPISFFSLIFLFLFFPRRFRIYSLVTSEYLLAAAAARIVRVVINESTEW